MQAGSIVEINYTGKVVAAGAMFESTVERKAIEAGKGSEHYGFKKQLNIYCFGKPNCVLENRIGGGIDVFG